MTPAELALIVLSWAPVPDWHGYPIRRPKGFEVVAATVALEQSDVDPTLMAAILDTLAAHESSYRPSAHSPPPEHSCGAFQTPCASTPPSPLAQARLASTLIRRSLAACPQYPLAIYASGRCADIAIARTYWAQARQRLQAAP